MIITRYVTVSTLSSTSAVTRTIRTILNSATHNKVVLRQVTNRPTVRSLVDMDPSLTSNDIRKIFIDYFVKRDHDYVHSSSVIPHDDPTLLFANAGMNQFKPIILSTVDPNSDFGKLKRAVNSQKCIRAGGKHNDLDDVGKDNYHHTFFEMLGSWSFGDYFKKKAIELAWDLLVNVLKLPKDRMYVTYFGGCEKYNLGADEETKQIWLDLGVPPERVLPFGMKDNFWEMGEFGSCGPCTEIHYDRVGGDREVPHLVNQDDPEVLEIWNIVFTEFNNINGDGEIYTSAVYSNMRALLVVETIGEASLFNESSFIGTPKLKELETTGEMTVLPMKTVDTGMGLERITSVVQGKWSNYDTDLFVPIFSAIEKATGCRAYSGKMGCEDVDGIDMAYRVLADHIRTLTIAISDGGKPDNTGRGYVLRRILRRAIRYAHEKIKCKPGMFASLVTQVVEILGEAFPELQKDPQMVMDVINEEEKQFLKTLSRGRRMFERTLMKLQSNVIPGEVAWRLYDTYGFPLDLTTIMAEEQGKKIDLAQYETAKQCAQAIAKGVGSGVDDSVSLDVHAINELKDKGFPATDDSAKYHYTPDSSGNYTFEPCTGVVVALRCNREFVQEVGTGQRVGILLDKTNFYAEQGGQIYDTGFMSKCDDEETEVVIRDVQVKGGYIVHMGTVEGVIKVGDKLNLLVDTERRRLCMNNHTGTHALNFALRKHIGATDQRGSLVAPDRLRFDFSAKGAMSSKEVKATEQTVLEVINGDNAVYAKESALPLAKEINGIRAIFDEVYPDPVRVITIGVSVDELLEDPSGPAGINYSVEFCGGTHLHHSKHIGSFAIVTEEAIAKGIRRIVALTGTDAEKAHQRADKLDKLVEDLQLTVTNGLSSGNMSIKQASKAVVQLQDELSNAVISQWRKDEMRTKLKTLKKTVDDNDKANKAKLVEKAVGKSKEIIEANKSSCAVVEVLQVQGLTKALDAAMKQFKSLAPSTAVLLLSEDADARKIVCMAQVPQVVVAKGLKADEWVKCVSEVIGGKAGGRELSAQGSGPNVHNLSIAVENAKKFSSLKLGD